jgi:hypothetical protein
MYFLNIDQNFLTFINIFSLVFLLHVKLIWNSIQLEFALTATLSPILHVCALACGDASAKPRYKTSAERWNSFDPSKHNGKLYTLTRQPHNWSNHLSRYTDLKAFAVPFCGRVATDQIEHLLLALL